MFQTLAPGLLVLLPILVFMAYVWWSRQSELKSPKTEKLSGQQSQINGQVTKIERELLIDNDQSYTRYRLSYYCQDEILWTSIWHYEIDDSLAVLISLGKVQEGSIGIVLINRDQDKEVASGFRVNLSTEDQKTVV